MASTTITKIILRKGSSSDASSVTLDHGEPALVSRNDSGKVHFDLYVGGGTSGEAPGKLLASSEAFYGEVRSGDPAKPEDGNWVMWMSDGTSSLTGIGAGDIVIASTTGNVTKYQVLFDHSGSINTWS